jgi:drug/metabolite transporter (DMT)-like permease
MLAYLVLGESLTLFALAGMGITLSGVAIVVLERSPGRTDLGHLSAPGVLYALIGAIGQGAGLVFAKMAFREAELDSFVATTVRILSSLVPLLPLAVVTGRYSNPIRAFAADPPAFRLTLAGSLLGPFLGISFSLVAAKYTDIGVAATIMAIVPILMLPLVRILYREHLTPRAIAGAFIAVAGVAVLFLR